MNAIYINIRRIFFSFCSLFFNWIFLFHFWTKDFVFNSRNHIQTSILYEVKTCEVKMRICTFLQRNTEFNSKLAYRIIHLAQSRISLVISVYRFFFIKCIILSDTSMKFVKRISIFRELRNIKRLKYRFRSCICFFYFFSFFYLFF